MTDPRPLVVHVVTRLELGGAQQGTLDTCRRLDRRRFRVALLAGPDGRLDSEAARIPDLDFRLVAALDRPVRPWRDYRAYRTLVEHLRDLRGASAAATIVHTHSSKAGILGRLAAPEAGVRHVVHTVHGFGHAAFRSSGLRRIACAAERRAARRTSHVVCVSEANRAEGERRRLFGDAEVSVIRSGFDVARFRRPGVDRREARRRLGLPAAAPVVGTVACLKPQKDPVSFVRTAAAVRRNEKEARFVLVGDGALRERLRFEADRLGDAAAVELLGWRDDVAEILPALDVFLLTSRWEGLPRAVVQAMAAGVPVVASAVDGVLDVVEDDETGLLVEPGDVPGFARAVRRLLDDRTTSVRLSRAAAAIPDAFGVDEMVDRIEGVYERLLRTDGSTA
ncbi:MAG: glycosyltransferase [Planctomycetota bacterium JB042]